MALITQTLLGVEDKVQHAIETLQAFCPREDGYYVAFSGGKDSVCVKKLCDLAGVKYDAHYRVTSIDPPELVQFIKRSYPDVEFEIPRDSAGKQITMASLIPQKRMPPTRVARYCCEHLKETGGYGRMVVTGVRWAESVNRRNNQGIITVTNGKTLEAPDSFERTNKGGLVLNSDNDEAREWLESCYKLKKTLVNPIIDWEDEDVWEFIHKYNVPYCDLYDKGYKRLGCIGCPMSDRRKDELDAYPKYKNIYLMAFEKMLKARDEAGLPRSWETAQEVMDWWLSKKPKETEILDGQIELTFKEEQDHDI